MNPLSEFGERPARILIVDDERLNRDLLEVMVLHEGHAVVTATTGEEALALVARDPPDLILLDVMMPGMDGYEVARRIKGDAATTNILIVMVTALDDHEARLHGLNAGVEEFLSKPVDRAELCARLKNLLRLKAYADYHDRNSQRLEDEVLARTAEVVESERLYRETFNAAPVGIAHVNLDGRWLRVNQRVCDLLGCTREALEGELVQALTDPEDLLAEADLFRQMRAGTLHHHVADERRYRRQDGGIAWARGHMSVHRDADGEGRYVIVVLEDITERRQLEAQVRQASKMDAIGRLASGVAHDFNNLLTVILGYSGMLASDPAITGHNSDKVDEIIKASKRAAGLTRQLLAFSRQQMLQIGPIDVNAMIDDMAGMLGMLTGPQVDITQVLAPDVSLALSDRGQLEQVVMNLVVNAKDAMPDGGSILIETADVDLDNTSFHEEVITSGRYVMLAVTDSGQGMSAETQRRLFEPFFTTKDVGKGTGLGLSTTYGIVKQSQGYIWVYSAPGRGTTFKVYLPCAESGARVPRAAVATVVPRAVSETVLLVEDEVSVRQLARQILDDAGYTVFEAGSADAAQAIFTAQGAAITLLIADVIMPGLSGLDLYARLQQQAPALRVLFMSGYTEHAAVNLAGIDRGVPFVQKPFTIAEFARQVRASLDRLPV